MSTTIDARKPLRRLRERLGGAERARVIVLFACVLGLETADLASLGAVASRLKPALQLDNAQLGLLAAAPALVAAVATLPMGVLSDRARRTPLLALTTATWAAAMLLSGASSSFAMLLVVRLFLGAATAASAPLIASLVGDLFWPDERARVYGYILAGQLVGSGVGLLVAGNLAAVSWRAGLCVLALPSIALAWTIHRTLTEPARGGAGRLARGGDRSSDGRAAASAGGRGEGSAAGSHTAGDGRSGRAGARGGRGGNAGGGRGGNAGGGHGGNAGGGHGGNAGGGDGPGGRAAGARGRDPAVVRAVRRRRIAPRRERVLDASDPENITLWEAVRFVLGLRTNVVLIVASALGYFFQAGVNTFGVVFVIAHFAVSQAVATWLLALIALGALAGTVLGGRLADTLLARGYLPARMVVGGVAFVVSAAIFAPGLVIRALVPAMCLYLLAAAALAAPGPALDAARLDIIPAHLWGRAESIRTVLRTLAVALAPLAFGFVSDALSGGHRTTTRGIGYHASGPGLKYAFLLMLIPMTVGGLLVLAGARSYPRDVATAMASEAEVPPSRRRVATAAEKT